MRENAAALSLPLLPLLAATALLGVSVVRRRYRNLLGNLFLALLAALAVWIVGHFFELLLIGRPAGEVWKQVKYIGVGALPPLAFALGLVFSGRRRWLRPGVVGLLAASGTLGFVFAATDELHHLFFTPRGLLNSPERPLFWLVVALAWTYVLAAAGLIVYHGWRQHGERRRTSFLLAGSFVIPLLGNVLDGFGLLWPLDVTVVFLAGTLTLLALSVFRYNLLDVVERARREVVDAIDLGVVVFDAAGRAVDANVAAARLLGAGSPGQIEGKPYDDLFVRAGGTARAGALGPQFQLAAPPAGRQRVAVQVYPVASDEGVHLGRVAVLRDAPDQEQPAASLAQSEEQRQVQQEALEAANLRLLQKNLELGRTREEIATLNRILEEKVRLEAREAERLRREIAAERARVRALVDQLSEGVIVLVLVKEDEGEDEDAEARVKLVNATARRLWPAVAEPGFPSRLAGPANRSGRDTAELAQLLHVALREGRPFAGVRGSVVDASGAERQVVLSATPLTQPDGQQATLVVLEDVTGLAESQDVKEEFLAIVTHELKAPLTVIRGYVQALLHDPAAPPDSDQARSLRSIERQASRMSAIVSELLDASRIEIGRLTLKPEPTLVARLLQQVFAEAQVANPSHRITLDCAPAMERVVALWDPARVEQVLGNLIQNAVKYSPAGSEVRGTASVAEGFAEIVVHDQGPGIPRPAQRLVFERYYQAPEDGAGRSSLGLGLYISREIVRAHGGRMWVVSEPGAGSAFHFTLPVEAEEEDLD